MRTARPFPFWKSAAFCALFALLATGCAKEELVAPVGTDSGAQVKSGGCGGGDIGTGTVGNSGPKGTGISDDGNDQGDNEKSRKKPR